VLPGKKGAPRPKTQQGLAPLWRSLFVTGIICTLLVGSILLARVALAGATMELLADSALTIQATQEARAEGTRLEVRYAIATNPVSIQEAAATQLGMSSDPQVDYLRIPAGE
jgi:nucleoside recognition membrane protein YjiH